ncbi:MAG: LysM peptidoglycan-binding domain-containing protein [Desulforhopalus sp.]
MNHMTIPSMMSSTWIFPRSCKRILFFVWIFCWLSTGTTSTAAAKADPEDFPEYGAIQKNVIFWEKIYGTYSVNEAVIHDSEDLSIIYEVIPLLDRDLPGASRLNAELQNQARESYKAILMRLAGQAPQTQLERRVAALFTGPDTKKQMAKAANNVRSQTGQKERFSEGVTRSGLYLKEIKRIFRSYNLPETLAYLPHVESSFNTKAYSKFGAAGIWQFTRSTGKRYLTIDYTVDERLDPIRATYAAAEYLQNSYRRLNSWPLALTSYNYGLSGMLRAVQAEGDYVQIFKNYKEGHFKFASKNFYSEFLAALKVARRLEQSGRVDISSHLTSEYFTLRGYVSFHDLSRHFKISTATLQSLNPALRPPVISGEKLVPMGYTLRLPARKKTTLLISAFPSSKYHSTQKPSAFHRVQKGDTASSIAMQHKVSLDSLLQANNLDKFATIYLGQKLRIPGTGKKSAGLTTDTPRLKARTKIKSSGMQQAGVLPVLSANKKIHPSPEHISVIPPKDPTVYNVFSTYTKNGRTYGFIIIQPEESLGLFAEWLGTTSDTLARLNGIKTESAVTPGQKLLLDFNGTPPGNLENNRLDYLQETEEDFFSAFTVVGRKTYRVSPGDTLWDLCYRKFDIPLWLLERYNSTMNLAKLSMHQELIVPIIQPI